MHTADPLTLPLAGTVLVEASAGTGKTFTIATLYLRLLIEARREVDQILVVTFTDAATQELQERVRGRITEALSWLECSDLDSLAERDPVLHALLTSVPDREDAARFLVDQLARMDEAAIHTIHGFCKRILEAFAFESGTTFATEFMADDAELRRQGAADFWRARVSTASEQEVVWIREGWPKGPASLLADLGQTLASDDLRVLPEASAADIASAQEAFAGLLDEYREIWPSSRDEVADILSTGTVLNQRSYNKSVRGKALAAGDAVAEMAGMPDTLPKDFDRLTPAMLAEQTKPGAEMPRHRVFDLCGRIQSLCETAARLPRALFLREARDAIRATMDREKARLRAMFYDDLLTHLDRALSVAGGDAFAERIRARLPAALVDEFQDTDPTQARIFQTIYGGRDDCCLLLCGDPKQAIYSFRGADIFAYMNAKRATREEVRFTLGTNWRSSSRMVRAFNALFGSADNPFLFAPEIAYEDVAPSPRADGKPLLIDGVEPVPLQIRQLRLTDENESQSPKGWIRVGAARTALATHCAECVAELLTLADAGKATLGERALTSGDIAILVRSRHEGELVQEALRACGVASVTLSQDSVYGSEDAEAMGLVLEAIASPQDEPLLRAALATGVLGFDAHTLESLSEQETEWENVIDRFMGYRAAWDERGFIAAFQDLLDREDVAERLLARPDGERRLTNILQLAELLQVASREHGSIAALLAWFTEQRAGVDTARGTTDEDQLRLESDRGLVTIMTLHKSKGLEFPVVFLPFAWSYYQGDKKRRPPPLFHDREGGNLHLDLGSPELEQNQTLAKVETLAEQLRLFYVGVTRAAKLCVLGWGKVSGADGSGLAYLLHQAPDSIPESPKNRLKSLSDDGIHDDLAVLATTAPECIGVGYVEDPTGRHWAGAPVDAGTLNPAPFSAVVEGAYRWRVSSYSSLVAGRDAEQLDRDATDSLAPAEERASETSVEAAPVDPVFELPAGTQFGVFVHSLLEKLDFTVATGEALLEYIAGCMARYRPLGRHGDASGVDQIAALSTLITRVLDTPLGEGGEPCLRAVSCADRLDELEFHLSVSSLSTGRLAAALADDARYAHAADGLTFAQTRGLLRGFIDLVFRHDGRFYVVDYKSNLLGSSFDDYSTTFMAEAIRDHGYDLQYLIYTLALHRYLRQRLPGYDYETHFGGVRYLFLRGMNPAAPAGTGVWSDRPSREIIERLDRLLSTTTEEAA